MGKTLYDHFKRFTNSSLSKKYFQSTNNPLIVVKVSKFEGGIMAKSNLVGKTLLEGKSFKIPLNDVHFYKEISERSFEKFAKAQKGQWYEVKEDIHLVMAPMEDDIYYITTKKKLCKADKKYKEGFVWKGIYLENTFFPKERIPLEGEEEEGETGLFKNSNNKANLSAREAKIISMKDHKTEKEKESLKRFYSLSDHLD